MALSADIDNKIHFFARLVSKKLKIDQLYVFGSSAKGGQREWSDIDLAIVSSDFSGDSFEDCKVLFPFILKVDRSIEIHPFRPADFTAENPFVREIIETGIQII